MIWYTFWKRWLCLQWVKWFWKGPQAGSFGNQWNTADVNWDNSMESQKSRQDDRKQGDQCINFRDWRHGSKGMKEREDNDGNQTSGVHTWVEGNAIPWASLANTGGIISLVEWGLYRKILLLSDAPESIFKLCLGLHFRKSSRMHKLGDSNTVCWLQSLDSMAKPTSISSSRHALANSRSLM